MFGDNISHFIGFKMTPSLPPQVAVHALVVRCQLQADFLGFCLILVKKWPIYLKRHIRRNNSWIPKFRKADKTAMCWEQVCKISAKNIQFCGSYLKSKLGPLSWRTLYSTYYKYWYNTVHTIHVVRSRNANLWNEYKNLNKNHMHSMT